MTETVSQGFGCVYVVATPIGNLEDLSPRAQRILREVVLIACEDTRRTAKLCTHFGISTRRESLHAHNEASRIPGLIRRLKAGDSIALVSDAGTPLLSDPGERLVAAVIEEGLSVVSVPGPSALLAALVASGLPTQAFHFSGFPPRKSGARRSLFASLASLPSTLVFYEAPGRLKQTLGELHEELGGRRVAIARELTKLHEEILRGRLGALDLAEPRGEVTLIVEGAPADERPELDESQVGARIDALLAEGISPRDAARRLADELGWKRSEAYRRVLERVGQ
ncbi:MAG: 16S rRNA (cytidine(1402)-2'-O)-methyltransferase [bacterium]|nr:16S rRNA (cytidine(1402)-2'-O)-methyltransferase [bacterium]